MLFLDELVENLFPLVRELYALEQLKALIDLDKISSLMTLAKKASLTTRKRIFVIMEPHAQGWSFAKTL